MPGARDRRLLYASAFVRAPTARSMAASSSATAGWPRETMFGGGHAGPRGKQLAVMSDVLWSGLAPRDGE